MLCGSAYRNRGIEARRGADADRLAAALARLAEEDPALSVRTDPETGQTVLSGMGELHLEVAVEKIRRARGPEVGAGRPRVAHRETVARGVSGLLYRQVGRPRGRASPEGPLEHLGGEVGGPWEGDLSAEGRLGMNAVMTIQRLGIDELLTTTRSVRKRLDLGRPVPLELVRECLEIALQAPTGGNRQGWEWVVVTDAETRARIGEYYGRSVRAYHASGSSAGNLFRDDPARAEAQQRVSASSAYLGEHMGEVPVLVLPCIRVPGGKLPEGSQAGLWGSLLPAAWSYMLAARARGLGTAWTTLHLAYESEVAELLGLPGDVRQGALIPTAYYTGDTFRPARRQPLDEVLHLDRWTG